MDRQVESLRYELQVARQAGNDAIAQARMDVEANVAEAQAEAEQAEAERDQARQDLEALGNRNEVVGSDLYAQTQRLEDVLATTQARHEAERQGMERRVQEMRERVAAKEREYMELQESTEVASSLAHQAAVESEAVSSDELHALQQEVDALEAQRAEAVARAKAEHRRERDRQTEELRALLLREKELVQQLLSSAKPRPLPPSMAPPSTDPCPSLDTVHRQKEAAQGLIEGVSRVHSMLEGAVGTCKEAQASVSCAVSDWVSDVSRHADTVDRTLATLAEDMDKGVEALVECARTDPSSHASATERDAAREREIGTVRQIRAKLRDAAALRDAVIGLATQHTQQLRERERVTRQAIQRAEAACGVLDRRPSLPAGQRLMADVEEAESLALSVQSPIHHTLQPGLEAHAEAVESLVQSVSDARARHTDRVGMVQGVPQQAKCCVDDVVSAVGTRTRTLQAQTEARRQAERERHRLSQMRVTQLQKELTEARESKRLLEESVASYRHGLEGPIADADTQGEAAAAALSECLSLSMGSVQQSLLQEQQHQADLQRDTESLLSSAREHSGERLLLNIDRSQGSLLRGLTTLSGDEPSMTGSDLAIDAPNTCYMRVLASRCQALQSSHDALKATCNSMSGLVETEPKRMARLVEMLTTHIAQRALDGEMDTQTEGEGEGETVDVETHLQTLLSTLTGVCEDSETFGDRLDRDIRHRLELLSEDVRGVIGKGNTQTDGDGLVTRLQATTDKVCALSDLLSLPLPSPSAHMPQPEAVMQTLPGLAESVDAAHATWSEGHALLDQSMQRVVGEREEKAQELRRQRKAVRDGIHALEAQYKDQITQTKHQTARTQAEFRTRTQQDAEEKKAMKAGLAEEARAMSESLSRQDARQRRALDAKRDHALQREEALMTQIQAHRQNTVQ
ncbi:hypothetical protein KIPB_000592 [Kipferlia bialata]|uniref:Uncharacterized protein n=1 Tax=Kipferlia bialata TaxID=797122 RepID=A0A9K3GEN3_9EUKA|nr:hypothetical protein KIPB_000592 [Kipferlia bialata]|eukprot:g592.t1